MIEERFDRGMTGLSPDMEDFLLEQSIYYEEHPTMFWSSFWKVCAEMWSNGVDITNKQLAIIEREYNKVEEKRRDPNFHSEYL